MTTPVILLIESDPHTRRARAGALIEGGYWPVPVDSAEEALRRCTDSTLPPLTLAVIHATTDPALITRLQERLGCPVLVMGAAVALSEALDWAL